MKKLSRVLAVLLSLCLAAALLPGTAVAAGTTPATVKYINVTASDEEGNPTAFAFSGTKGVGTIAVFVNGGTAADTTYTYTTVVSDAGLLLVVNNAVVTVGANGAPGDYRLSGTAKLIFSAYDVTAGNCTAALTGSAPDIENVVGFYNSATYVGEGETPPTAAYSYTVTADMAFSDFLTAYDLTVNSGATLTIHAPTKDQDQPEFYRLTIKNSLTVNGALTADAGQKLEIGQKATVAGTGLTLYDTNGTSAYSITSPHSAEEFSYINTGTAQAPVWRWVRQDNSGGGSEGGGSGSEGSGSTTAAPTVSFCVQNTDTGVGTVQYKIGTGNWKDLTLTVTGEGQGRHLSGTITDTLAQNNVLYIKATPATGYEMDTNRGVKVSTNGGSGVAIDGGVTAIVSVNGLSYTLTENTSYEFEFGFRTVGSPGGSDPGGGDTPPAADTPDYAAAKTGIEGRHWAYYTSAGTAATMKTAFSAELWDMLSHEYPGVFANSDAASAAVTVTGSGTATIDSELGSSYPYYTYSVALNAGTTATGKVYVLDAADKFVVRTTVGSTNTFTVMAKPASGDAVLVKNYDAGGIEVFGNSVAAVGTLGSTASSVAYHVAPHINVTNAINCTLVIYKTTFAGAKLTRGSTHGRAAAWDFGSYPMAAFGTSPAAPAEFRTYFGDGSVTIAAPTVGGIAIAAITGVTTTLPAGAVTITGSGGTFTVAFHSNFYDQVPLTIAYTDSTGASKTGYLLINRVGLDIQCCLKAGNAAGNDLTLLHGTQNGATYTNFYGSNQCGVFATFYYPTNSTTQVELVATYTWQNGSVTRQTISEHKGTGADVAAGLVAANDFQLYAGTTAGLPMKIEVIAVRTGGMPATFAGASLGSGAGVAWECPAGLRN